MVQGGLPLNQTGLNKQEAALSCWTFESLCRVPGGRASDQPKRREGEDHILHKEAGQEKKLANVCLCIFQ